MNISFLFISEVFIFREAILPFVGACKDIKAGTCNIKIYKIIRKVLDSRWNIVVRDIRRFFRAGNNGL